MANKHLSFSPKGIDADNWYYEMPGGIHLIHMQPDPRYANGKGTITIKISWRKLRASLKRKDKKP